VSAAEDPTAAFRIEAGELLEQVEQGLLDLGHRLDDMNLVNAVFRGLHTLKGSGAMFGFDALAAFTHHCESAFDRVRKGDVRATPELVSVILSAADHMRTLVDGDAPAAHGHACPAQAGLDPVLPPAPRRDGQWHQPAGAARRTARAG
jgi:two-component system chemotaxis sensor kinase CheA